MWKMPIQMVRHSICYLRKNRGTPALKFPYIHTDFRMSPDHAKSLIFILIFQCFGFVLIEINARIRIRINTISIILHSHEKLSIRGLALRVATILFHALHRAPLETIQDIVFCSGHWYSIPLRSTSTHLLSPHFHHLQ